MTNEERSKVFKDTLELAKRFFSLPHSIYYRGIGDRMKIVWSENTVKSIFEEKGKVCVLNFADDWEPGGLVWEGIDTQEECLCRCSNLYLSLVEHKKDYYAAAGGIIYSKDVVFFKDWEYKLVDPVRVDVITCAAPVAGSWKDERIVKKKMEAIVELAKINGCDVLILGRWGCGAFGNDWKLFRRLWGEVLGECLIK